MNLNSKTILLWISTGLSSLGLSAFAAEDLAISRDKLQGAKLRTGQGQRFSFKADPFEPSACSYRPFGLGDFGPYYVPDGQHDYSAWDFYLKTRNQKGFPEMKNIPIGPAEQGADNQMVIPSSIQVPLPPPDAVSPATKYGDPDPLRENLSKRLSEALEQRFKFLAKLGFKHSPPLCTFGTCVLMPDARILDVQVEKKSSNVLFNIIAFQTIKSLDGDRHWDSKTPMQCAWSFSTNNGDVTASITILKKQAGN